MSASNRDSNAGCGIVFGLFGVPTLVILFIAGVDGLNGNYAHGEPVDLVMVLFIAVPLLVLLGLLSTKVFSARMRGPGLIVAAVISGLIILGINGVMSLATINRRPSNDIVLAAAPACQGQAITAAGDYSAGVAGQYHLVLLDESGEPHLFTGYPPLEWRPTSIADMELVVCVTREQVMTHIETCHYNGGSDVERIMASMTVKVVKANTGKTIASFDVQNEPRQCERSEKKDVRELSGSIGFSLIEKRLQDYVLGVALDK